LLPLLRAPGVNPRTVGHAAARLLERKHALGVEVETAAAAPLASDRFLADEIARLYLSRTINVSAAIERLLTASRGRWLEAQRNSVAMAPSRWDGIAAVAIQCFINEFVWAICSDEQRDVDALEERIVAAFASAQSVGGALLSDLLVYACYRPLWRLSCASRLMTLADDEIPAALAELLRVSLREPLWEQDAKAGIATDAAIQDRVSRAVQAQYEENPYPRWLALTRAGVQSIEQRVQRWNPEYAAPEALRASLRVLIAGCGTGMDAIDTAVHLRGARVTAIDLSRASLAYAMRKAREYGLENIEFRQADILAFNDDSAPYHFINCTGVLHHMRDPRIGLHRLVRMLMPDGLIRLALYSRLARAPLDEVRATIRTRGFGSAPSDVRAFRQQVLDEGPGGGFAQLMGSTDFFSLSDCRDLLFHVQETAFTVPGIKTLLEEAGLEFLGFELTIPEVERGFRRQHPGAALTDLDAWAAYEQQHPHSFRAMYQFWCRKDQ